MEERTAGCGADLWERSFGSDELGGAEAAAGAALGDDPLHKLSSSWNVEEAEDLRQGVVDATMKGQLVAVEGDEFGERTLREKRDGGLPVARHDVNDVAVSEERTKGKQRGRPWEIATTAEAEELFGVGSRLLKGEEAVLRHLQLLDREGSAGLGLSAEVAEETEDPGLDAQDGAEAEAGAKNRPWIERRSGVLLDNVGGGLDWGKVFRRLDGDLIRA